LSASVVEAVEQWLAGRELDGADAVRAATVRRLARAVEDAPAYAMARLATALAELVGELERGDASAEAARILRGLEWLRN